MPIERFSVPKHLKKEAGVPIGPKELQKQVVSFVSQHFDLVETLVPGEYDLTPRLWKNNSGFHNLLVTQSGTGIYRIIPRYPTTRNYEVTEGETKVIPGGRVIKIPEDQEMAILAGPLSPHLGIRLFEVIFYSVTPLNERIQAFPKSSEPPII